MIPGTGTAFSRTTTQASRHTALPILALIAAILVFAATTGQASAQEFPSQITGRVVQGTPGEEIPIGTDVVLLVVDEARQEIIANESQPVGTNGEFVFTDLLSGPGLTYRVAVDYSEYTPSVDLRPGESSFEDVELTIYASTETFEDIRVSTYSMLVPSIDRSERLMGVLGVITLINSGDRVWIPDIDNPNLTGFDLLRFNLPEGFTDLSVESNLPAGNILEIPTGFALTNPLPPGEFNVLVTYIVQYEGDTLSFPLRLPYGADQVRMMLPEGAGDIAGLGFGEAEGAVIEDTAYSVVTGRDYARDSQVDVIFSSLPTPSLVERAQNFFEGRGYIVVIAWIAGAAMLGLLAYAFFFARSKDSREFVIEPGAYPEYDGMDREQIIEAIATLDQQHDDGELEDTDYNSRRAALTQAALSAGTAESQ